MSSNYKDFREWLESLSTADKLWRIKRTVKRETELTPIVRWQYRGLDESKRKAFLFENIVDAKGRRFDGRVAASMLGASTDIFALGLKCDPKDITDKLTHGMKNPIDPKMVSNGPVKEEIHKGDQVTEHGGIEEFPIPISCPGFEPAPYISCGAWVTKDPDTGIRNVGVYRDMLKGQTKISVEFTSSKHIGVHLSKCKERSKNLEAACILGMTPDLEMSSTTSAPYGADEFAIAGGISGEPLDLVKCETVDLEVPAGAEIVLEGEIASDYMEPEGPYSEYPGYMSEREKAPIFHIKCITHRKNPIVRDFTNSGMPPSETSKIRQITRAAHMYKFLNYDCNIPAVMRVALNERCGPDTFCVIQLKKTDQAQPWRALNAIASRPTEGKVAIVVDDDINPEDMSDVIWALVWRVQPHRDIRISPGKNISNDPSRSNMDEEKRAPGSSLLIDATRKWPYPPIALPAKEHMEHARKIWEEEGLPELEIRGPWHGKMLGWWPEEFKLEAELAVKGEYMKTAEKHAAQGWKV